MDLAGWDVVFAISVDNVNSALAAQSGKLIDSFSLSTPISASGHYGHWQIVPGGAGTIVQMSITISDGAYQTVKGPVLLAGGMLNLKIALSLLPQSGGVSHLVLDLDAKAVSFISLTGVPALGEIAAAELGAAFAADLSNRADEVSFVLASVSPVGQGGPTWLTPADLAFSYVTPSGGASCLGIFAVTTNRDTSQLGRDIDPALIGSGGVGLALAPALFLDNVFGPALAAAFNTSVASIVATSPTTLGNKGDIGLPSVSKAGETYYPVVNTLAAQLADDRVKVTLSGNCDMHMNINMSFNASSSTGMNLGAPGQLAFATVGSPSFSKDVDIPWYDHLLDLVTIVSEAILDITVAAIASELSDGVSHVAGTSALASQAPGIVGWVGGGGFTATSAGLAGCLWLQGRIS